MIIISSLERKATVYYTGGELTYSFPFSYLKKEFIKVKYVNAEGEIQQALTYIQDYTVEDKKVILKVAGSSSNNICIYRQTTTDIIVSWSDGSVLKANDMSISDIQMLHILEEFQDVIYGSEGTISGSATEVKVLLAQVNSMLTEVEQKLKNTEQKLTDVEEAVDSVVADAKTQADKAGASAKDAAGFASTAFAASASAWDSTKTYNYPDVIAYTDGNSYRCTGTNITGTDVPGVSTKWVKLTLDTDNFWEVRNDGGFMPSQNPAYSKSWELNSDGDMMPKGDNLE